MSICKTINKKIRGLRLTCSSAPKCQTSRRQRRFRSRSTSPSRRSPPSCPGPGPPPGRVSLSQSCKTLCKEGDFLRRPQRLSAARKTQIWFNTLTCEVSLSPGILFPKNYQNFSLYDNIAHMSVTCQIHLWSLFPNIFIDSGQVLCLLTNFEFKLHLKKKIDAQNQKKNSL